MVILFSSIGRLVWIQDLHAIPCMIHWEYDNVVKFKQKLKKIRWNLESYNNNVEYVCFAKCGQMKNEYADNVQTN